MLARRIRVALLTTLSVLVMSLTQGAPSFRSRTKMPTLEHSTELKTYRQRVMAHLTYLQVEIYKESRFPNKNDTTLYLEEQLDKS